MKTVITMTSYPKRINDLLFNILPRFVRAFHPRSKCLLISWLQSRSEMILEPKKIKPVTVYIVSPSICHEVMRLDAIILIFWMLRFTSAFSLSSFTFIKRLLSFSLLPAIKVVSFVYLSYSYFSQQSWLQRVFHPAWHYMM